MTMTSRLAVLAMLLFSPAAAAQTQVYVAGSGADRMALVCNGDKMVDTPCFIRAGEGIPNQPVRFTTGLTRYPYLLKEAAEKAIRGEGRPIQRDASDLAVLRGLEVEKCHPDALMGDLLQLCVPAGSPANVVLFMRGLCDRCSFEPVVLRRQAAPK
jgi:hypothetical protein